MSLTAAHVSAENLLQVIGFICITVISQTRSNKIKK